MKALEALEVELTDGTIQHVAHDTFVSDDHAVVLMKIVATRSEHGSLDAHVVYVFHVRNGKLAELWVHPFDQASWDAFWG
jgi:ketosteroid isomerase-like protein